MCKDKNIVFPTVPRVVVTGNKGNRSFIANDSLAQDVKEHFKDLVISDIWATDSMPVAIGQRAETLNTGFPQVPKNGSYVRYVTIPPDRDLGLEVPAGQKHPLMHQTDTLDYIIILSGELYLILDEEETLLKPGDIVVQTGTNHAWSNRSDHPCVQLAILLDASV
ncbi:cupin domain-containing protein [Sphingobacterium bambusae]|uniref:Cupin domain-containing protein n=1 Tax=Sphingobacterium bambusae TaxID=662858 RepID=A0ABW6BFI1_9SPHI|nr:cupin domain-containing protein [Sphingobacterium bambusae]WPL49533.1 cupin domain-containing protein [Sphingobacterium bambusae]